MNLYKFSVVIKPSKENGETYYNVTVPALPEVATFGMSETEALFMAQDALELVILCRLEDGESIPANKKPAHISKNSILKEVLISVSHDVRSTPITNDVKLAFA